MADHQQMYVYDIHIMPINMSRKKNMVNGIGVEIKSAKSMHGDNHI